MLPSAQKLREHLQGLYNEEKKDILQRFFKTGIGEYGEGDLFLGITVPQIRQAIKPYYSLPLEEIEQIINSQWHEVRLAAILILVKQAHNADAKKAHDIYTFYMNHVDDINNWDLVDLSAPQIVGNYLMDKDRSVLLTWAQNNHLWLQRIAIVATHSFIKQKQPDMTFQISDIYLHHPHDLIQKATGWMLREVGKKSGQEILMSDLTDHKKYQFMPRTMLRYAIERFPEDVRQKFLKGQA